MNVLARQISDELKIIKMLNIIDGKNIWNSEQTKKKKNNDKRRGMIWTEQDLQNQW